jgi:adenylyl-sulfate kinase
MRDATFPAHATGDICGAVVWLTGLPSSGKSTIARRLAAQLRALGEPVEVLDGDVLRAQGSADLGFSPEHRVEQARRAAVMARSLLTEGVLPIVAVISPSERSRAAARAVLGAAMLEVYVDAPVAVCERRDVKGLYARARRGELAAFTGVSAAYEPPAAPALRLHTATEDPGRSARRVLELLLARGAVDGSIAA